MRKLTLLFSFVLMLTSVKASVVTNAYQTYFDQAYQQFPQVPRGMLEAVSFSQTRFKHITTDEQLSCFGLPQALGVMGLTENGQGYFRNNMKTVSRLSGYSLSEIKNSPKKNILAYASAYSFLKDSLGINNDIHKQDLILIYLSELPWDHNTGNQFALSSYLYQVYSFLDQTENQTYYQFPNYQLDMAEVFGEENYKVLSSSYVTMTENGIFNEDHVHFQSQNRSTEYAPALWVATPTCNYSSRSGTAISAVTVHTIQGSYAGAISWAQNCSSNVSYHYVERSSDGQVTQMVLEADKAWHVGNENPYTIGIEHEGYVSDASWYTQAMYESSADLVRDITNSGYGINPLRTYYGVATSGVNVLGGCTKIKGHQHYPNNTHTDPGINWDWEKYYKLINNSPTVTTYTAATGSLYDSGGASANYTDDERYLYLIEPTSASNVTINFDVFDLEEDWDYMYIYDGSTTDDALIGVYTGSTDPGTISSSGGALLLEFRSDCSTNNAGWEINWVSNTSSSAGDITAPTTSVTTPFTWHTQDFTATFTDQDEVGGSGVKYQLYQVIDYDGADWRANADSGFFSDNFDLSIHTDWTQQTGAWSTNGNYLICSDETVDNSNIYTSLNQNNDDVFLYAWGGMIGGSGSNRRAGLHFMCSDPTLDQRGNSYMVYFRADQDKIQIYESVSNSITLEADVSFTIDENVLYDLKVLYDKQSGEINVYVDNELAASWTDSTPLLSGDYISLRQGNCIYTVNNLKAYHSRGTNETISVGPTAELRYQSQNASTAGGRVKSMVIDSAMNISSVSYKDIYVDWTEAEYASGVVNDGTGADINTFTNNTTISANWNSGLDTNSDVSVYWYAIGTSSGATDVLAWTDNWFDTTVTHTGLSLSVGTTYYVSMKIENGAGLMTSVYTSDGQTLIAPTATPQAQFTVINTYVCGNDSLQMINNSTDATDYVWTIDNGASPSSTTDANPYFSFPTSGTYTILLEATGPGGTDTDSQTVVIQLNDAVVANFDVVDTVVDVNSGNVYFTNNSTNADGYYWDFGNGQNSTDVNPWTNYSQTGVYQVMLVALNGVCPNDTSYVNIHVMDLSNVTDYVESQVSIYPNPTTTNITVKLPLEYVTELRVFNAQGQCVDVIQPTSSTVIMPTQKWAKGMYQLVFITNEGEWFQTTVIKE